MNEPRLQLWAIVDVDARQPEAVTAEMLGELKRLSKAVGGEIVALVLGELRPVDAEFLAGYGAERILHFAAAGEYQPELHADLIAAAIAERSPHAAMFPGTALGRELGLRVALIGNHRFASGCVNLELSAERLTAVRPIEGGSAHQSEHLAAAPYLFALIPDSVGAEAPAKGATAEVEAIEPAVSGVEVAFESLGFTPGDPRTMDLADADAIVAGGRGVGGTEGFELLQRIADRLGAALGASRPAVEAGWMPYERQVGQTGHTVTPKLYLACGISGATQHLAGMRDAKVIIAINTDPGAPIFGVAKLAVEGDLTAVLEALAAELESAAEQRAA